MAKAAPRSLRSSERSRTVSTSESEEPKTAAATASQQKTAKTLETAAVMTPRLTRQRKSFPTDVGTPARLSSGLDAARAQPLASGGGGGGAVQATVPFQSSSAAVVGSAIKPPPTLPEQEERRSLRSATPRATKSGAETAATPAASVGWDLKVIIINEVNVLTL